MLNLKLDSDPEAIKKLSFNFRNFKKGLGMGFDEQKLVEQIYEDAAGKEIYIISRRTR